MTDENPLQNEPEENGIPTRVVSPTDADVANFAMNDARVGETDAEKSAKADMLGKVYLDLLKRAQTPSDPNRTDDENRAEAAYFSESLTGYKDAHGTLWRKGGFKTGAEYLAHMKEFFLKSPEDNKTQALRDFEALDEKGQEDAALEARKWTLENAGHVAGNAFGYAMDLVRPNTTHRAGKLEKAAANYDLNDAEYRRKVRAEHYADLLADNAWIELSSILPRLSKDGRACTEALMKSPDNALPETMYAKFNNLPDDEKQMIIRARTVLKPRVEGSLANTIGDLAIGFLNVTSSVLAGLPRLGQKLFASGTFDFIPGVDSDFFDYNKIARNRNYLWQATGRFFDGGSDGVFIPQLQFEQLCENHGIVADALIGAVSTLPYMAAASVPGIGMMMVAAEAMNEMDDHVVMQGGDITDPDYIATSALFGGLYAYTERLQVEKLLGGVSEMEVREALLGGFVKGISKKATIRNLAVGTISESLQEGLQNGIMGVNEALALDQDATRAFADGFVKDFVGSLGTMFIVEAGGLAGGHWRRSGYNNPFSSAGREAGREARSTDLEAEYNKFMCQDRMVEYAARSAEAKMTAGASEAYRLVKAWEEGGADALIKAGVSEADAAEFDYFYRTTKEGIARDEETGEEAMDIRRDKAQYAIAQYISSKAAEAAKSGEEKDREAFAAAMTNMDWVRSAWSQGAGVYRKDEEGNVQDPGAKALEKLGFSTDVAARLSRYFHYERAAAYSPAALAGIKARYETRMAGKVTAKAALAQQFGGKITRFDGADYLTFAGKDGTLSMVRIDETPGGVDFTQDSEGLAVSVERATDGKVTAKEWISMSAADRELTWNEHGLMNEGAFAAAPSVKVTLPSDPSVGVDSAQAAQIVGTISLDSNTTPGVIADTSAAFHETYHAFANFAQASGLWTKEDVAFLEKTVGKARHSRETHDEEAGAEGFRSFLARRAAGAMTADDEHSPYMKIYAAAAGLDRIGKENEAREKIAERNETAFFQQLIAEANRPKPKPAEKPDLPSAKAPAKTQTAKPSAQEPVVETHQTSNVKPQTNQPASSPQATTTWSAYTPTGNVKVSGHWSVLDLADVIHSNNPLYAVHMRNQLRNRKDNKAEEDTRKDIVNNFQPERLMDAPDTANGAPIVFYDDDGSGVKRAFVLSGNGRVLILNELAERHLYDRYRNAMKQWAADHGIFVPEGQTPVLVRVIDDYGGATRDKVADLSNTNSIQQYTEEEQARADAEVVKALGIARLYKANADGSPDMTPGANDDFFSEFIRGVNDNALYNSDRSLTQAARDRAQRALLAIAAGQGDRGRDVVKKLVEQTETLGIQKQKNAIMMMAAPVAALETNAAYAIGPDVSRAIADFMDYAEKHKAGKFSDFSKYLAQMDLLDAPSAIAKEILALLGSDKPAATIAEYVKAYCKAASMEDPAGGLFGAARTRDEIWNDAKKLVESRSVQTPQTPQAPQDQTTKPQTSQLPVLSVDAAPAPSAPAAPPRGTVTHTVETKSGTVTAAIPTDPARDGLRNTYDPYVETPESPDPIRSIFKGVATRQNDPQGRYWGDKMPQFMGHKTEMFDRTVMTLRQKLAPEERAKFDTVVDYFGGGGCWGMSLSLAAMPNVKRIVINEFDPGRAKKIELLQTLGENIVSEAEKALTPYLDEIREDMRHKGDDGGESGSGATLATLLVRKYKPRVEADVNALGLMYAVSDCASRQLAGSRDVRDPKTGEVTKVKIPFAERWQKVMEQLAKDGKNATAMRKAFESRGGKVEYVNGDSTKDDFGVGFKTPHGGNVMAVADPPYYRTEGYSDDGTSWKVGLESVGAGYAYADTMKLIGRLVDNGDGLVYTDEAWWLKPEYLETHRVQTDGLFDDSSVISASREFRLEHEILGGIRNMLDHFDVAGKVAGRYETLGVHHGKQTTRNGVSENDERTGKGEGNDDHNGGDVGSRDNGSGVRDDTRRSVRRMVGGAEGEDRAVLRSGGDSGQRSNVRTEDVVRDVYASIEDAAIDAKVGAINKSALEDMVRRSVRQVREDKQLAYANLVSKNAAAYLKRTAKRLDAYMAAHGYTEKVWHGTEGDDFNVFQFSSGNHGVSAAYFSYRRETAENYAALRSLDVENLDNAKPNVRAFYVNPGKVLDIDEDEPGHATNFNEFVERCKKAYADGYDAMRIKNTYDDQGFRFNGDETMENMEYPSESHDVRTDILIVFDRPGNPGANRIKAADPVTFMDDVDGELPIPLDMRADQSVNDVRYSVKMAMKELADGKEKTTLRNEALGDIEYNIGRTGKKGFGLLHIVEQRMLKDGATLEEAVDTAINVATAAEMGEETEARHNTHHLDYNGTRAIVGVMPDKSIAITGYEIYAGESTVAKQRAAELSPRPHVRLDEVVRVLKEKLASAEESIAYPAEEVNRADRVQTARETPEERHSVFIGIKGADKAKIAQGRLGKALELLDEYEIRRYKDGDDAFDPAHDEDFRRYVYVKTGWWMGTDGMWRFEISDLKPKQRFGKTVGDGSMMKNGIMFADRHDHSHGYCDIESICRHPTLFKAYPELKDISVKISDPDTMDGYIGQYNPAMNQIEITWDMVQWHDDEMSNILDGDGLAVLTHELQHAVQHIEDFNRGGSENHNGRTNYDRLAGEVEARNAERRMFGVYGELQSRNADEAMREEYADNYAPWKTEDVPQAKQILVGSDGAMRDQSGNPVARHSVSALDTEADARRAITAYAQAEGNKAANDALENYVAYFKLSHGSIPRAATLARIGLSLGMNVVDPKRIIKNADKIAEQMRGTIVEQASKNGDVATAMSLIKREKDASKKIDALIAGGVAAGGKLTHKGVGQVNTLLQRRVETMMRSFTAATLADMEGDTGIDLAAEIIANNPDAFDVEYRRAKGVKKCDDSLEEGSALDEQSSGYSDTPAELSDADKYKREQLVKRQAERVAKFIEEAKARAEDNKQKAEERRRRVAEIGASGGQGETPAEGSSSDMEMQNEAAAAPAKADFKTPGEFAAFLRVWAADRFMKLHGHSTLAQAQKDKLFAEFYRICVRQEMQDLADKLLAPKMLNADGEEVTNQRLAKLGNGARVWASRRIAAMEKGIRPDTLERMSADVFAFINKAAVRVSRADIIASFKDELKRRYIENPEFDEFKQDTERKLTGWVEEATRYIAHVCDLSRKSVNGDPSQLEEEYRRLHEIIDERTRVYDESGANAAEAAKEDAETRKAQWKLALLDKYGAMRSMMPGEILDLQNAAFDYLENEAKKLEDAWKDTRERQDAVRRDFAGAIVGPGDQRYDAGNGLFGWLDKTLLDSLNGLLRLRLEHLTRFAPDALKTKAKDAVNAITVMLGEGEVEYAKALQADREAFFAGLGEIFKKPDGKADNRKIKKYLERMDEPIPVELSRKLSSQGFANAMTYGQMLQLLVSLEQRSFKETIEANGRLEQADIIRSFRFRNDKGEAVNAFTREDEAFVQWLRAFYAAKRERLSEVTERMVGQKVDSPDPLYCPIRRWIDDKAMTLHSDPTERWDPISKIFSRRVPSTRDFDESRTIVGLFFENSKESAKLTAWAERGSFIRNVVTSVPFQAAVKRAFGPGELGKILKQLEATFNGGERRSQTPGEVAAADKAVNFVTYAYLGFNPLSSAKQTTSFAVWANQLPNGFADLWRHMTHVDMKAIKHLMESDEYKVRYGDKVGSGMDYATKGLNMNPSDNPVMTAIRGAGMWMLKRGDFVSGAWIAQGVYKDLLDKHTKEGMEFSEADRLAIVETFNMLEEGQQSARTYNTNMLQIEHGRIGRLLTQFATSPLQQLQYETQALREWRDMVRYQMGKEKIAEARSKYVRAVVINHVIIPAAMNLVIAMYKAAIGEEPPWEEDGYHWTLLIDLLLGQFSRVFFLGAFAQTTLEALFKRKYPRGSQILPVEGAMGMAASGAFLVHDLATMDVEKLQNDIERAMKSTAPTRIPYNITRRFLGDSDVDRKRRGRERRR